MTDKLVIRTKSKDVVKFKWSRIEFKIDHNAKTIKVWKNYDSNDSFLFYADLENIEYVMRITE